MDPGEGYTETNTAIVCWMYNRAKGANSHDDVVRLARAIVETAALREQLYQRH